MTGFVIMRTPCDHRPLSQPIETRVCSSCAVRFPKGSSPLHFPTRSDVVERSIIEQGRNAFENTIELFLGLCASGRSTRRTLSVAFFFFPFLFFFSPFSLFFFAALRFDANSSKYLELFVKPLVFSTSLYRVCLPIFSNFQFREIVLANSFVARLGVLRKRGCERSLFTRTVSGG